MSERPTPETDAFIERNIGQTNWEWRVHSRRLERERDEAREKLRKTRKFLEDANRGAETNAKIIQVQLDKILHLRRENDEARAFIEELVDLVAYGLGQHGSIWSQAAMTKAREAIAKSKSLEGAK